MEGERILAGHARSNHPDQWRFECGQVYAVSCALQARMERPFWYYSIDHFRGDVLPWKRINPASSNGPRWDPLSSTAFTAACRRWRLPAMTSSSSTSSKPGVGCRTWSSSLDSVDVYFVGLHCPSKSSNDAGVPGATARWATPGAISNPSICIARTTWSSIRQPARRQRRSRAQWLAPTRASERFRANESRRHEPRRPQCAIAIQRWFSSILP